MTRVDAFDIPDTLAGRARLSYLPHTLGPDPQHAAPRVIRIALAGCGVVGGALVRLLDEAGGAIEARHGVRFQIARVLVRDLALERGLPIPTHLFTDDPSDLLAEEVDVVVEAIGGDDVAGQIARVALARGRRFITANKELVASAGSELAALAGRFSGSLEFGAAVGGSAPVISLLRDLLGASLPKSVRGILNGTSNYVLTQLERGKSFDEALSAARARGLAEADSTRDLDGSDSASKLAIIAWVSFGISPGDLLVRRIGLGTDPSPLVRHAAELGGKIRLIAECTVLDNNLLCASVEPVLVSASSAFGRTDLEDNRVEVDLGWAAPLSVSGPGAGGTPTATALLGDLLGTGAPRNERGMSRFKPVSDTRRLSWLVVAGCALSRLENAFRARAVSFDRAAESGGESRLFASATWASLAPVVDDLVAAGVGISLARADDAAWRDFQ